MQLLEENSNEIVLLSLNAIKEFTYQEGYEYKLSLLKQNWKARIHCRRSFIWIQIIKHNFKNESRIVN